MKLRSLSKDVKNANRVMNLVDDRYIEEAADGLKEKVQRETDGGRKQPGWKRWTALAACLCLVLAGGAGIGKQWWDSLSHDLPYEDQVPVNPEDGLWIPAMELPEMSDGMAADMIACVVYNGGIYAHHTDGYYDEDADAVRGLLGEKLGTAKGNIDEWSSQDAYAEEFAGSIAGDVYAVKGYDTSFRIAVAGENSVLFMERLNGITIKYGADVFEDRLHLSENWKSLSWLDHETWNYAEGPVDPVPVEISDEVWNAFLGEINEGKFEHLWSKDLDAVTDDDGRTIYDRIVLHLYVTMEDGTVNQLRISEDGYVLYEGLLWYGVKISDETLQSVLAACR